MSAVFIGLHSNSAAIALSAGGCLDRGMRRLLAIALLVLLGMPLASSMLALGTGSVSEANVPICCRRGGAHHCALAEAASDAPRFAVVTARCPYQVAHVGARTGDLAGVLAGGLGAGGLQSDAALAAAERDGLLAEGERSNQKRGPPTA